MRTTLAIDDDVLAAVKDRARRENRTAGEVISDLARQALTVPADERGAGESFGGFRPFSGGRPVTRDLVRALMDEEGV